MNWQSLDFNTSVNAWLDRRLGKRFADYLVAVLGSAAFIIPAILSIYMGDFAGALVLLSVFLFIVLFCLLDREGYLNA